MDKNNIILYILVICVLYLLYKVNKKEKESFNDTTSSTGVTTTATPLPKDITLDDIEKMFERKIQDLNTERSQVSVTESIKNLGILARRMNQSIDGESKLFLPSNLEVGGFIRSKNVVFKFSYQGDGYHTLYKTQYVPFNNIDFQVGAEDCLVDNKFVAPVSGYYSISAEVFLLPDNKSFLLKLVKVIGEDNTELETPYYNGSTGFLAYSNHNVNESATLHGSTIVYLHKNDSIGIMCDISVNGNRIYKGHCSLHGYLIST